MAHGPSRSAACGIPPDEGSNPCPLHWQADSQPLRHQGSRYTKHFYKDYTYDLIWSLLFCLMLSFIFLCIFFDPQRM